MEDAGVKKRAAPPAGPPGDARAPAMAGVASKAAPAVPMEAPRGAVGHDAVFAVAPAAPPMAKKNAGTATAVLKPAEIAAAASMRPPRGPVMANTLLERPAATSSGPGVDARVEAGREAPADPAVAVAVGAAGGDSARWRFAMMASPRDHDRFRSKSIAR